MNKSPQTPNQNEIIAKEDALREPTPVITLPGYPENYWDTTEPYLQSYPGSEPTLAVRPPQARPENRSPQPPEREAGPPPMAEPLRIRQEVPIPPVAWLVATLAGIALGATAWIVAAVAG